MQIGNVTTPFGRRPAKLCLVKIQLGAGGIDPNKTADKWRVFRNACEARLMLGVTDRALAVLSALLSFHPEKDLSVDASLIVFPSNAQLSLRAHGIAGTTLRRHLAALVDAGLIIRHDSPNGKRYRRRDEQGDTDQAFGFSLAPLLARAEELEATAAAVVAERQRARVLRERLTICRRDVRKLISAAVEEGVRGNWAAIETHYVSLVGRLPRLPDAEQVEPILEEMQMLRDEILNILDMQANAAKSAVNDVQTGRHIQNTKPDSPSESEPANEKRQGANPAILPLAKATAGRPPVSDIRSSRGEGALKAFPLALVLKACPEIASYGPGGAIASWRDLMGAAVVVRSMLGVSPSAYQEACEVLGPENAATTIACILERAGHISSAGGYLRSLTERARKGEFGLGPMLMALLKVHGQPARQTG